MDFIFNIALFSSLGIGLALMVNSYIETKFFSLPPENVKPVKTAKVQKKEYKFIDNVFFDKKIEKSHISKISKDESYVKPTKLSNFSLLGTIKIGNKQLALIEVNKEKKFVSVGDVINGYKVEKIEKYKVVLSKGNNTYVVGIKLKQAKRNYVSSRKSDNVQKTSSDEYVYKLDRRFVQEQTADIGKFMKDVFIVPVVKNGETVGFKFKYVKPGSLLYKYGLRSGDFIVSINGNPITTVEEAFKIYNMLRNEELVKVEIERNGKKRVLVYEIR